MRAVEISGIGQEGGAGLSDIDAREPGGDSAAEDSLDGAGSDREARRSGVTGQPDAALGIEGQGGGDIEPLAAEVSGVNNGGTRGVDLGYKGVVVVGGLCAYV